MATKEDKARELRIPINGHGADFRVPCPACSPNRKKKKDPCLHVTIDREAIRFHCHHCQEFKGTLSDDEAEPRANSRSQGRRQNSPPRMARGW